MEPSGSFSYGAKISRYITHNLALILKESGFNNNFDNKYEFILMLTSLYEKCKEKFYKEDSMRKKRFK